MKTKPIHEVASKVLAKVGCPMAASEIHDAIVRDNLYSFQAKDLSGVVRNQLRRHSDNVDRPASACEKRFHLLEDGRFQFLND